jgi:methyltransferase family protein
MSVRDQLKRGARGALKKAGLLHLAPPPNSGAFERKVDADVLRASARSDMARLFYGHRGREAHKWDHYLAIYERHLGRFRGRQEGPVRLLELGVAHGGSLQLWRKYFGASATIFGIDVDPRCRAVDDADLCVRIGSQADRELLRRVVQEMGGVDIVVDDGSHVASHQRISFQTLFPLLDPHGVYVVEDLQSAYWRGFEGGWRRKGSFIEEMKELVDDLHAAYSQARARFPGIYKTVESIHFYDSMVVVEKMPEREVFNTRRGSPSF